MNYEELLQELEGIALEIELCALMAKVIPMPPLEVAKQLTVIQRKISDTKFAISQQRIIDEAINN